MKRQIKFRGFCTTCKEKIEGDLIHGVGSKLGKFFILPIKANLAGVQHCHPLDGVEVLPDSIGQFTGLKDIKGKDIYEGDIVRYTWTKQLYEVKFGFVKKYTYTGWYAENYYIEKTLNLFNGTYIEIIGNIYENSELLNSQK